MEGEPALMPVVLDSSVILAYLLDEQGREAAEQAGNIFYQQHG